MPSLSGDSGGRLAATFRQVSADWNALCHGSQQRLVGRPAFASTVSSMAEVVLSS